PVHTPISVVSQKGIQQPSAIGSHSAPSVGFAHRKPGSQALMYSHASYCAPPSPEASSTHRNALLSCGLGMHRSSPGQSCSSGSQNGRHRVSTPPFEIRHEVIGVAQLGASGEPTHCATHTPTPSVTSQHITPFSQLSMPLTPLPSTVHGSPTAPGFAISGVHFSDSHEL